MPIEISSLIARGAVLPALKSGSKKQLFQELGCRARDCYRLEQRRVIEGLMTRERLGSTALGKGVAVPHARLAELETVVGLFARVEKPIDFDAPDGQPVDLICVLLAPEESGAMHLRALARVSRLLSDADLVGKLRATDTTDALYALLTEPAASRAA